MRIEYTINAVLQSIAFAGAVANDAPDFMTKALGVLAGVSIGSLVAAVLSGSLTNKQRMGRFAASFGTGFVLSIIALWIMPDRAGIDPREWIFVVSAVCAFMGWRVAEKFDDRADDYTDDIFDAAANRVLPKNKRKNQQGRVRLVPLVLLAGLAALCWVFRDVLVLLWLMLTVQVH